MAEFEDSIRGSTDVSGMEPIGSPKVSSANMDRKAHQGGAPPEPPSEAPSVDEQPEASGEGGSSQDGGSSKGGPAGDIYAALLHGNAQTEASKPFTDLNPFSPIDWGKQQANDAWMTYQTGRRVANVFHAFLDGNAISNSVHNIWEQDSAQAKFARLAMTGGASAMPGANQKNLENQTAGVLGAVLPMTGNPTNAVAPESLTAGLGVNAVSGLVSADPNEQAAGMAWAALTGAVLGGGHLPPGAKGTLAKAFQKWPEVEGMVRGIVDGRTQAARNAVNPDHSYTTDWISETLKKGRFAGSEKVLKEAAKEGDLSDYAVKQVGKDVMVQRGQLAAQRSRVLKKLGVDTVDDLVTKANDTGFTGKQAKLIAEHWKELGLPYDLRGVTPGDNPLRDPRRALLEIHNAGDDVRSAKAQTYLSSVHHYLDQIHRGSFSDGGDPVKSIWRSLLGVSRHDKLIDEQHAHAAADLLTHAGVNGEHVAKAVEGDMQAYDSLDAAGKMVVDGFRLITNSLRHESSGTGYAQNFVGNWMPHIDKRVPGMTGRGGGKAAGFTTEARKHRNLQITTDAEGNLIQTQQFTSAHEANAALDESRKRIIAALTNPLAKLPKDLEGMHQAEDIRKLAGKDPDAAMAEATKLAEQLRPHKETDFLKVLGSGVLARQMKALHSHKALGQWEKTLLSVPNSVARVPAAVKVKDARHAELLKQQGYSRATSPYVDGYMFHGDLADLLDRATTTRSSLREGGISKKLLDLESQAIGRIMFMPQVHAMNVLGRSGMMWMKHPVAMTHYLLHGKALLPHQVDEESFKLRSEAYNSGVLPHSRNLNYAQNLQGAIHGALGDTMEDMGKMPITTRLAHTAGLGGVMDKLSQGHSARNNYFWGAVNDFGTMAYHLEKDAAMRSGLDEGSAKLWAARRANTWMGHVAPEDTNPVMHDIMRGLTFAPNWWRTWGELMVPIYKRSGVDYGNPALLKHIAQDQAKTMLAMLAFQKMTGNVFNIMASGHLQNQNLPGNQDRVEMTAPWVNRLLGPGVDQKTGARRTVENPMGRFQRDVEEIAGLQSGHPDWQPHDVLDGSAKFAVSRLSPLVEAMGAMANFDVYHAVTTGMQNTRVDQRGWSPWNVAYAGLMMSPLGMTMPNAIAQAQQKDAALQDQNMPFGTKVSRSMADAIGTLPNAAEKVALSWLTGVNPPYMYAERSRGIPPSDQQWQRYNEAKKNYDTQMQTLSAQALGGQMTPSDWLQKYRSAHSTYSTIAQSTFQQDPHYVNGDEGMLNDYEALYEKATGPDGTIDYSKLDKLQAEFRHGKDPDALHRMDVLMHANDQKYPMLALYHKTNIAYRKFQDDFASQHGVDAGTLRRELAEYGKLHGDSNASARYLQQHREVSMFEAAKKRQFDASPAGLMHGLFYNSSVVATYMRAHHLTAQQVEQQAEAAP